MGTTHWPPRLTTSSAAHSTVSRMHSVPAALGLWPSTQTVQTSPACSAQSAMGVGPQAVQELVYLPR